MDRGPVALFGAIVAVGLGPALWLGAQIGSVGLTPEPPPPVVEANQDNKEPGGAGAGPTDPAVAEPKPESRFEPLSATPSRRSATSAASKSPEPDDEPATESTTEPTASSEPSTPPAEETTEPTESPTGEPDPGVPTDPVPPAPDEPDSDPEISPPG